MIFAAYALLFLLGVAAWTASFVVLTRANPTALMSVWRNPRRVPGRALALRGVGIVGVSFATSATAGALGGSPIPFVAMVLGLGLPFLLIPSHNRQVEARAVEARSPIA